MILCILESTRVSILQPTHLHLLHLTLDKVLTIHHPPTAYWLVYSTPSIVVFAQLLSRIQCFAAPWNAARQASLSFTISLGLLKLMPIESVVPSNHLILCHPLFLLPSASGSFPTSQLCTSGGQSIDSELIVRANLVFFHQPFYFEEMFL